MGMYVAWMREGTKLGMYVRSSETRIILIGKRGCHQDGREKENMAPMWKELIKNVDLDEPTSFHDHVNLGCTQCECKPNETIIEKHTRMFESRISAGQQKKYRDGKNLMHKLWRGLITLIFLLKNALNDSANWQTRKWSNFLKSHILVRMIITSNSGNSNQLEKLSVVCSQMFLKCLYIAQIGRLDILWLVNKLARSVRRWTQACDRRLARLISCIHHTNDFRQYCHVGNTAQHRRLGLFQDSDFAGDFDDSKSTSGVFCVFLEFEHLSQSVGCARSKLRFRAALQNQRSYRWMLVCAWTVYLRSTCGFGY